MERAGVVKAGILAAALFMLFGCTAAPKYGSSPPKAAEPAAATGLNPQENVETGTFVGTITGGNYAKGVGFSNINVKLFVTSDSGEKVVFFVRSDSKVYAKDGKAMNYVEAAKGKGKKVEITHFIIQDGSGGDPSRNDFAYEIGQKGVLTLRFLD